MTAFDLPGVLRRIRRHGDLSQRDLAALLEMSKSSVAAVESGDRGMDVRVVAQAAAFAGLRLALFGSDGREVSPMGAHPVRDLGGRRFPAHLDAFDSDERWWRWEHRYDRPRPWFTFDRDRPGRDRLRQSGGTPEDHPQDRPGDSPADRAAARRRGDWRRRADERERAFLAGEFRHLDARFECTCPPACDELDDWSSRPVHAEGCPCLCDLA